MKIDKNISTLIIPAINLVLDHAFTFKGQKWDIKSITVPHNTKPFNWFEASDHLPIIAELELQEQNNVLL